MSFGIVTNLCSKVAVKLLRCLGGKSTNKVIDGTFIVKDEGGKVVLVKDQVVFHLPEPSHSPVKVQIDKIELSQVLGNYSTFLY